MNKIICVGDTHLGHTISGIKTNVGSSLNIRVSDQIFLLEWVLEQAIENVASDIIITGDVFEDPKPQSYLIALFISWLKKCETYNVNVHIIVGNHDILRSGFVYSSPLDIISEIELDNVSVYKDINTVFIGTSAFTFMPFRDRKSLGTTSNAEAITILSKSLIYELASIPKTYKKTVIGHLAIEGSIPVGDEIDDITNELFCPIEMFEGYDYVWMGHVHRPQIMNKKSPFVAHIGSMDISNFGETDHNKHIVIMNCNDGSFTTEILPTRTLKKINIVIPKDTADPTNYVLSEINKLSDLNKAIVKVEVSLENQDLKSIDKQVIENQLMSCGVFNIASISESKKPTMIKKDGNSMDTKMDVSSAIKTYAHTYVDEYKKSKFIELSMEIYQLYKATE